MGFNKSYKHGPVFFRFWVTERRVFQDKLDDETRLVSDREVQRSFAG